MCAGCVETLWGCCTDCRVPRVTWNVFSRTLMRLSFYLVWETLPPPPSFSALLPHKRPGTEQIRRPFTEKKMPPFLANIHGPTSSAQQCDCSQQTPRNGMIITWFFVFVFPLPERCAYINANLVSTVDSVTREFRFDRMRWRGHRWRSSTFPCGGRRGGGRSGIRRSRTSRSL